MTPVLAAYGVVVALISAAAAWFSVRRQRSGNIRTSQAEELWLESKAVRVELRAELVETRNRCREDIERLERRHETEVQELRDRIAHLEGKVQP